AGLGEPTSERDTLPCGAVVGITTAVDDDDDGVRCALVRPAEHAEKAPVSTEHERRLQATRRLELRRGNRLWRHLRTRGGQRKGPAYPTDDATEIAQRVFLQDLVIQQRLEAEPAVAGRGDTALNPGPNACVDRPVVALSEDCHPLSTGQLDSTQIGLGDPGNRCRAELKLADVEAF